MNYMHYYSQMTLSSRQWLIGPPLSPIHCWPSDSSYNQALQICIGMIPRWYGGCNYGLVDLSIFAHQMYTYMNWIWMCSNLLMHINKAHKTCMHCRFDHPDTVPLRIVWSIDCTGLLGGVWVLGTTVLHWLIMGVVLIHSDPPGMCEGVRF